LKYDAVYMLNTICACGYTVTYELYKGTVLVVSTQAWQINIIKYSDYMVVSDKLFYILATG